MARPIKKKSKKLRSINDQLYDLIQELEQIVDYNESKTIYQDDPDTNTAETAIELIKDARTYIEDLI